MRSEIENNVANVIRYKAHYVVETEWIDENSVSNDYDYESNEGVIVLKDGVTEIGEGAFTDSFDIVSVEIPNTITTIGMGAFAYSVISSVVIPNSVTEICEGAFNGCDELKSIYIPASVERIGVEAFLNCTKLNSIEVDKSNLVYDSRENCNAIIETKTNKLLFGCKNAFIPNSITEIEDGAFYCCEGLMSIVIPDSVRRIGECAFYACYGLKSIVIPSSVTRIGNGAFYECCMLDSIEVDLNNVVYDSRQNCNAIIATRTNELIAGCVNSFIPEGITKIAVGAFGGCDRLTNIVIPSSVERIGENTFCTCYSLTDVKILGNVTEIANSAFSKCGELQNLNFPESLRRIGVSAFYDCNKLLSLNISRNVEEIGEGAFMGCGGLKSIVVDDRNPYYDSRENCNPTTARGGEAPS